MSAAYIGVYFKLDFFMEANNMNPDQSAPMAVETRKHVTQVAPSAYQV